MVADQRDRLIVGVAEAVSEHGYAETRVKDILDRARISRRTFYERYPSKLEIFLDAYDEVSKQLMDRMVAAYEATPDLIGRLRACLTTFLEFVASEPAFADMCIVEVLAAGPEAVRRRNETMRAMTALIQRGVDEALSKEAQPPAMIAETIVGGIYEAVYARVLEGRTEELPALLPDLMYAILLPYAGREVAMAEFRREQRNAQER